MTALETLQHEGIVVFPGFSPEAAGDVLAFLAGCVSSPGHVQGAHVAADDMGSATCWSMADVCAMPYWFEWVLQMTALVGEYLDHDPVLYSLNAFTTYPNEGGVLNPHIQSFHRDRDDTQFLAAFVYLTPIETWAEGPHQFQCGSHTGQTHGMATVLGPAGTVFIEDARGLHRGIRPEHTPRTVAWARWGVSDPPASYGWSQMAPVSKERLGTRYPTDPTLQQVIRLVVQ